MKNIKMARSLDLVDDDLLEQAEPRGRRTRAEFHLKKVILVACITILLTAGCLWLFIPFNTDLPDVSMYRESEYYDIIQKLNVATFVKPKNKNNFDKYIGNIFKGATMADGAAPESGDPGDGRYRELTDNQVQGVIEGDRIKGTDTHIFYLNGSRLEAYSIAGESSAMVGAIRLMDRIPYGTLYEDEWEFYLSMDGKTATVVASYYKSKYHENDYFGVYVDVISLDVSDPAAMQIKKSVTVSGDYQSSRMVNGQLLLLTGFAVSSNPDFSKEFRYLPQIDVGNGLSTIPAADIICPETISRARYTVVCKVAEEGLALLDSAAFLSYSEEAYVSETDIFVTRTYTEPFERNGLTYERTKTEISCMRYEGENLALQGSVSVNGSVKNQYSMDVYDGILRVVTTTRESLRSQEVDGETVVFDTVTADTTNADLYCIDLANWQPVASVVGFAPEGESAESVRFDGENAYVCTAEVVTVTDPVYFFDLHDLSNITYKDTGVIEGYSTSLIQLGNGYLLGIGVGERSSLKVEIYEESVTGVVSVCKYELKNVSYSEAYKSYFIDRENCLVGLGISLWGKSEADSYNGYILLHFDGFELREVLKESLSGTNEEKRGVLIDGYFYLFGRHEFKVRCIYG